MAKYATGVNRVILKPPQQDQYGLVHFQIGLMEKLHPHAAHKSSQSQLQEQTKNKTSP